MLKILLVDDHAIVRHGMRQLLADIRGGAAVGEAESAAEALAKVRSEPWDVVVLDISLPDLSGLEVLKQIKVLRPRAAVLVLTMHGEAQYAKRVLRAGADGYLTKRSALEQLVVAVERVASGGKYVSPTLAERLVVESIVEPMKEPHELLSDREFQVMRMLVEGQPLTAIAERLSLSVKTVSTHRAHILRKMGLRSNAELVAYAIRNQILEL